MIQNTKISLDANSSPRQTAKGIIQYTLMLDFKHPDISPTDKDYILHIMKTTDLCCKSLISQVEYNQYNFFGNNPNYTSQKLTYLSNYPVIKCKDFIPPDVSISKLLVQNSLMMAYHALLTEYLSDCTTSSYQIVHLLKGAGAHKAMCSTKNGKNSVRIINGKTEFKGIKKPDGTDTQNYKATTFWKKYETRINEFSSLFSFTILEKPQNKTMKFDYRLQFAPLCHIIAKARHDNFKYIFATEDNYVNENNYCASKILEALTKLTTDFSPNLFSTSSKGNINYTEQNGDVIDGIYEHYLAEKSYSLNLFYDLLNLIQDTESSSNNRYSLKNEETLNIISKCKKLPCPFVRRYLLHFAFDYIDKGTTSYQDYWNNHDISKRDVFVSRTKQPGGFQYDRWLRQYELFIDYLTEYIIPVYDWYFICMLLEGIEQEYPEHTHMQHLESALNILGNYLQDNHSELLFPVDLPNVHQFYIKEKEPDKWIDDLRRLIYDDYSVDLNIVPLTRDLFTSKKNARGEREPSSNLQDLHDFYVESIINPY